MSKILVTGAEGQLGCRVVRQLLSQNYEVRGTILAGAVPANQQNGFKRALNFLLGNFERQTSSRAEPIGLKYLKGLDIELMAGDLTNPTFAARVVEGVDAVLHTANLVAADAFENNVLATFNVVKACSARADMLSRFIYVSSSAVYPNDPEILAYEYHPLDEIHPCRPIGAYALSKLIGEETVKAFARASGLAASIIRPSYIVSADAVLNVWNVDTVSGIMRKGANYPAGELYAPESGEPWKELKSRAITGVQPCAVIDPQGDPWVCQLVDARDVAQGLLCALESSEATGETFNISARQPFPFTQAAAVLAELTQTEALEYRAPVRWVYDLDNTKARDLIGYEPQWGIREMIEDALAFQKGETDSLT